MGYGHAADASQLHCERVGVLIMGVAVWAGGMTSTLGLEVIEFIVSRTMGW